MKNVAFVVVALGMVACNNPRPNVVDSGGIVLTDTGGGVRDTGPVGQDTGPVTGTCGITFSATSFGSLSAACFPRCSQATLTAINACPSTDDGTCLNAALDADTTASVAWTQNGMAATMPLDCGGCFGAQQLHCISANGCSAQVTAYIMCTATDCTAQETALNTCFMTNQTPIGTCLNSPTEGVIACFGG